MSRIKWQHFVKPGREAEAWSGWREGIQVAQVGREGPACYSIWINGGPKVSEEFRSLEVAKIYAERLVDMKENA